VTATKRLSRQKFVEFFAQQAPAVVAMECCGMAHHWGRQLREMGHEPVLLPASYVKPYVRRNKSDRCDAKAILEALRNEEIRSVPVKSELQQTLTALHRLRSRWMEARVAQINTLRGLLREFGYTIPVGASKVVPQVRRWLAEPDFPLNPLLCPLLGQACDHVKELDEHIAKTEQQLKALAKQTPVVERLLTIPGVGLLTATALVGIVGDITRFDSCRHFASYLGLTPREFSSGLRRRLGSISKRGDRYLRCLLVHGSRSVMRTAARNPEPNRLQRWALQAEKRLGHNRAVVALANKRARVIWAVWKSGAVFQG
jgi:transposase